MTFPLAQHTVAITIDRPTPLPGHQAPLDRRHRWTYRATTATGRFLYTCRVCRQRRYVTPLANLLARKMRDAARSIDNSLTEMLWVR